MRELSLFTGAGGGILGSVLLGHRIIGAVEQDEYCCRVLEQRQRDGVLEPFPIFQTDIRDFVRTGYAGLYKGRCDLVSGGFPCQPFSLAGKQRGADDPRNMWPATMECISVVRPQYALLENVPGLLTSGYFGRILGDLAESGYDARWRILSAAELGAPHKRDRLWIVAHASGERCEPGAEERRAVRDNNGHDSGAQCGRHEQQSRAGGGGAHVAHADSGLLQERHTSKRKAPKLDAKSWWSVEPAVGRMADGYAGRVAELRAAGNAQVASVVAAAWHLLNA